MRYTELWKAQAGMCAICAGRLSTEHADFVDGEARALLCYPCLQAIDLVNDQLRLKATEFYLKAPPAFPDTDGA